MAPAAERQVVSQTGDAWPMRVGIPLRQFTWLDRVRAGPGMYVDEENRPVRRLEALIHGYYTALSVHGIVESVPAMTNHFSTWLRRHTGWSLSRGWGAAIEENAASGDALAVFFRTWMFIVASFPWSFRLSPLASANDPRESATRLVTTGESIVRTP